MSAVITRAAWAQIRRRVNELVSQGLPPSEIINALDIYIASMKKDKEKK